MGNIRRVMVIADGDNAFMAAQSFNRKINWHKMRDYLADPKEGRELIEMVIYLGLPPAKERFEEQRKNKEKFIYWARSNGFLVVTKEGKAKGDDYENNVDVVMAIDAIELTFQIKPDIVVLVTGDSDFAYLAEKLRRRGIRVEVASVEQSLGSELKNSANSVVDLTEVFDKFDQHDTQYCSVNKIAKRETLVETLHVTSLHSLTEQYWHDTNQNYYRIGNANVFDRTYATGTGDACGACGAIAKF